MTVEKVILVRDNKQLYFDIEASNYNSVPFAKNEEVFQSLKLMFPDNIN